MIVRQIFVNVGYYGDLTVSVYCDTSILCAFDNSKCIVVHC